MTDKRLSKHLTSIIGIKIAVLTVIWFVFFSHEHPSLTPAALQHHLIFLSGAEFSHAQ